MSDLSIASSPVPSTSRRSTCSACAQPAVYTCPGCAARTCSASCSSKHKTTTGCTGKRNRAAYVPMNEYGYGTLMDDYTFLEDAGRHVGEWGRDLVREKLVDPFASTSTSSRGRGSAMRGRGQGKPRPEGKHHGKRLALQRHLDLWDIELSLLPSGMAKSQANKSTWDFKHKQPLLTVELIINAPPPPLPSQPLQSPHIMLVHQNKLDEPILDMVQRHVKTHSGRKSGSSIPESVQAVALPTREDPDGFIAPEAYLLAPADHPTPLQYTKSAYFVLDISAPLSAALRGYAFVEYPTIHVYPPGAFRGTVVDRVGKITRIVEEERPTKRLRPNPKQSKANMTGLLGGYGSGSDSETEEENVMTTLDGYAESDDADADGALGMEDEDVSEEGEDLVPNAAQYDALLGAVLGDLQASADQALDEAYEGSVEGLE